MRFDLVLRQARLADGRIVDVGIMEGFFAAIAPKLSACDNDVDCRGGLLVPGLHDQHIHLLATAARLQSVDLSGLTQPNAIIAALRAKASETPPGDWIRAIGYDERAAGIVDRSLLDCWLPDRPLRIQDRTGALWLLNSAGLALIGEAPWPDAVETGANAQPTGRIWRGDAWLRTQIDSRAPSLAPLSRQLLRWGVTAVTDAGASNGPDEAAIFSAAMQDGTLRQRLILMGREDLPAGQGYQLGPLKLLFDERDLPDVAQIISRIDTARNLRRTVAAHCVTEAELVIYLAALDGAGGARHGDRIEHGCMIPATLIADIARAQLTVVANPGFIAARGDRYLAEIDPDDLTNLHRFRSLSDAGIRLLAGSDAPYGPANPWRAIRSAMHRQAPSGTVVGPEEAVTAIEALSTFFSQARIRKGAVADCCLIDADWDAHIQTTADPNPVHLTLIGGQIV